MKKFCLYLTLLLCSSGPLQAIEIREFEDSSKAARYERLIEKLRCLVCQNQSLADSDADLARDLRSEVYEIIDSGKSEEEAIAFLTDRYGDFVLYDPPVKTITILLWAGPLVFLIIGLLVALQSLKRHRGQPKAHALGPEDRERLRMIRERLSKNGSSHSNKAP